MDYDAMRSLDTRDGVAGKVCSRCGQWKALQSFSRKLRFFHSACKQCLQEAQAHAPKKDKRAYYKRYREANAEKIAAYRKEHAADFKTYTQRWRKRNPDKVRANARKWEQSHPERKSESYKRWRKKILTKRSKMTIDDERAYEMRRASLPSRSGWR